MLGKLVGTSILSLLETLETVVELECLQPFLSSIFDFILGMILCSFMGCFLFFFMGVFGLVFDAIFGSFLRHLLFISNNRLILSPKGI